MRPGGGSVKGGDFERRICKELSLWMSDGREKNVFWRTAGSGSRATGASKKGEQNRTQAGDVSAVHPAGAWLIDHFVLELKHVKNLQLFQSVTTQNGELYKFWDKLGRQARAQDKEPLLIACQNRMKILFITSSHGAALLDCGRHVLLTCWWECPAQVCLYEAVLAQRSPHPNLAAFFRPRLRA
jgi:hypothetical protein